MNGRLSPTGIGRKIAFFRSLQTGLILAFLAVSIIPLVGVGWLTFVQSQNALFEQVSNQLVAVRDLKAERVRAFFQLVEEDIVLVSKFPVLVEANQAFALTQDFYAVRRLGYLENPDLVDSGHGTPYDVAHARYHELFNEVVETMGYDDLYLVAPEGAVVYNYDKGDDFGTNLLTGPYRNTHIADLFQKLYTSTNSNETLFTDFPHYGPSRRVPASFVGTPIVANDQNVGVLIYQLSLDRINELVQGRPGYMGETGEAYLVGPDGFMRTDSRFSSESTILEQEVDSLAVQQALDGVTGVDQITDYRGVSSLSAYRPMSFGSQTWALVVEIDTAEAFAATRRLRGSVLGITGVAVLLVIGLGLLMSRGITRPVYTLTQAATAIAEGDLSHTVAIETRNEIGLLAQAFDTMAGRLRHAFESLEDRVRERTHALETSGEISHRLTAILDLNELLRYVVNRLQNEFKFYHIDIFLLDDDRENLVIREGAGQVAAETDTRGYSVRLDASKSLVARAARTSEVVIADDVREVEEWLPDSLVPNTLSEMAIPITLGAKAEVVGVLDLKEDRVAGFDEGDANLFRPLANQVGVAIHNAQLYSLAHQELAERKRAEEQTQQALEETEKLLGAAQAILGATDLGDICSKLVSHFNELVRADRTTLILIDQDRKQILLSIVHGSTEGEMSLSYEEVIAGISGMVLKSQQPIISSSADDGIEPEATRASRVQNDAGPLIVVPLVTKAANGISTVIGTSTAINRPGQREFTQRDADLLMALTTQAAAVIENVRLFEATQAAGQTAEVANQDLAEVNTHLSQEIKERKRTEAKLQELATTDALTGINNRRHFFDLAEKEHARARRYHRHFSLILIDLDNFKIVNDKHGHFGGDRVLQEVARCIDQYSRDVDIYGRYGGDEFVVLVPETLEPYALIFAERLCQTIPVQLKKMADVSVPVTLSIGIANFAGEKDTTIDTLFERADQALYSAKDNGRNCVKVWERTE